MVAATTGLPDAQIVWLDLDYSSFVLAHALGATYSEFAADDSSPLAPLRHLTMKTAWAGSLTGSRVCLPVEIVLDEVQAADLTSALELAKAMGMRSIGDIRHVDAGSAACAACWATTSLAASGATSSTAKPVYRRQGGGAVVSMRCAASWPWASAQQRLRPS